MRDALLIACLLALALIPSAPTRAQSQVNMLLTAQLDPPLAGVRICWQTRCYETDSAGRWAHSVTVASGTNYELVCTDGSVTFVGVKGASGMTVTWISDSRVRFRFASAPGSNSGPITIYVQAVDATPTATALPSVTITSTLVPMGTPTATVGPSPTAGPTAMPTLGPNDPLPWTVQCAITQAALDRMWDRRRPPVSLVELRVSAVWAVANLHTGILHVWAQDPSTSWGASSNWRIEPGAPLTDEFTMETPYGQATVIGFCNGVFFRLGMRYYAMQWSACALSELQPDMVWVSREEVD